MYERGARVNAHELSQMIGRSASWTIFDLNIPVEVTDARYMFGRTDIQIQPVGGTGKHWCSRHAIRFPDEECANGSV